MVSQAREFCVSCARGGRDFAGRYREFLLDPGTLFTLASLLLLIMAGAVNPGGLVSGGEVSPVGEMLYFASAIVGSLYIWFSAIQGLRQRDFTADIPVSIATAAAIAIGAYSAAAIVAVLLLLGGMLEDFVAARSGKALEALEKLLPETVTLRREGRDEVVPLGEVGIGDMLLVRPGERVAVDGVVASGRASLNQAAITGESVAVDRAAGDEVFAGTLSEAGALEVEATRVGEETTLGQIRRMVEEAQQEKAPVERVLDRYAKLYTPIALILGALLWWWSGEITRAITMLIVFCPCVMVLATPTALVASIGNAAMRGSLVKKGATIEATARVDTVAFDKTGTLTYCAPHLSGIISLNGMAEDEVLRLSAAAEKFSEHPIGRAVVGAAEDRGLSVSDPEGFEALAGLGVRAEAEGRPLVVGRPKMMGEEGITLDGEVEARAGELAAPGRTVILAATGGEPAGILVLEDGLRPEAKDTVGRLNELGVGTVLISGDNRETAERIAAGLGVEEVHAEVLPQEKVEIIKELQSGGRRVAFVGDGVNDSPALAASDIGVAMGLSGTDVAVETAEIGLLSDDLSRLPHLLGLSQKAMGAIRQNLAFSLGVLAVAVGLTIPGILTPVTGALLHELSSIPVIANSARLIGLKS